MDWNQYIGKQVYIQSYTGDKFAGKVVRVETDRVSNRQMMVVDYGYGVDTKNISMIAELINVKIIER
ncbi:MAG: hypothetical protein PHU23_17895 [Dehalococcoidales bacterium]|nr:hypothetical protein [Dehalococcoidales bacterium]